MAGTRARRPAEQPGAGMPRSTRPTSSPPRRRERGGGRLRGGGRRSLRRALPDPAQTLAGRDAPTAHGSGNDGAPTLTRSRVSIGWCSTPGQPCGSSEPPGRATPPNTLCCNGFRAPLPLADSGCSASAASARAVHGRAARGARTARHPALPARPRAGARRRLRPGRRGLVLAGPAPPRAHPRRPPTPEGWLPGLGRRRTATRGRHRARWPQSVRDSAVRATDAAGGAWSGPRTVVVLDGAAALRGLPDLAEVLEHGPAVGICVLAVDEDRAGLPSRGAGRARPRRRPRTPTLHLPGGHRVRAGRRPGRSVVGRPAEPRPRPRSATPTPGTDQPARSPTAGRASLERCSAPRTAASRWHGARACVDRVELRTARSVPIGHTADGPFRIDLAADGPHVLVAGTTGAGKSELLRTLVASLAVTNRPEHLSMVLVDYKGGAAFRDCAPLPHVAAVVTDLDEHLAARALDLPHAPSSSGANELLARRRGRGLPFLPALLGRHRPPAAPAGDRHRRVPGAGRGAAPVHRRDGGGGGAGPLAGRPPGPRDPAPGGGGDCRHQGQRQPAHRHCGCATGPTRSTSSTPPRPPHSTRRHPAARYARVAWRPARRLPGGARRRDRSRTKADRTAYGSGAAVGCGRRPPGRRSPTTERHRHGPGRGRRRGVGGGRPGRCAAGRQSLAPSPSRRGSTARVAARPARRRARVPIGLADEPAAQRQSPLEVDLDDARPLGLRRWSGQRPQHGPAHGRLRGGLARRTRTTCTCMP